MAFVWLWRSTGKAPRLTKRARTMVDFLEELPDRAAFKPYLHRPQLPCVASSCFLGPVNQSVRCTELLTCFKHVPTWRWRESPCSVLHPSAGCFVHGGVGKLFSRPITGQGPGGADAVPSHDVMLRYGPFRDVIGRYKLGKNLGTGGFGLIRAGYNVETGDAVAVKIISKMVEPFNVAVYKEQLRREIFAMTKVSHPNIVQLLEVLGSKTKIFLVMELLAGGDLESSINRARPQKLTEAQARRYFQQILTAVDFCHAKGVYHRDLKPGNVLLDAKNNAKVADFGFGALVDTDTITADLPGGDLLVKSQVGTPMFMAPEILDYKKKTPPETGYSGAKADIFSCGVLLYYLLSRQIPFTNKATLAELQRLKLQAQYPEPWPQEIGPDARELITSMLDPIPAKRIAMASILEDSWFKQDYQPPNFQMMKEVMTASLNEIDEAFQELLPLDRSQLKPAMPNAFALITGAVNRQLGGMVQGKHATGWEERRYISKLPAFEILSKIGDTVSSLGYNIQYRGNKVRMNTAVTSRKGPLSVLAEVFQAGHDLVMVEIRKVVGDSQEFSHFVLTFTTALKEVLELVELPPEFED